MTYRFDGYNYIVRLQKDELLVASLTEFAQQQNLKGTWLNGLGGAQWAELGFYDLDQKQYQWQRFDELMEVTSLQGNLAWKDDKPVWHIHGTLSGRDFQAVGGHVKELCVGGTIELHLHTIFGDQLTRTQDDQTGLSLLEL
jgi:uncharacterized protein